MQPSFDSYSSVERRFLGLTRGLVRALFRPLVLLLARLGVSPNALSLSQLPIGVAIFALIAPAPRLAFLLMLLALLVDGLDGALARHTGRASRFGAVVDQYADHGREILVVAGLAHVGALNGALAALYALTYTGANITLLLCNSKGVPVPLAVKTAFVFYPALFLYLWFGLNYLDQAIGLMVFLLTVTIAWGLARLRPTLDG